MRLFHTTTSRLPRTVLLLLGLFFVAAGWQTRTAYAADETTAPAAQLYLPLIQHAVPAATPTSGSTSSPTPVTPTPAPTLAFFLDPSWKTSDANVAVDTQGG